MPGARGAAVRAKHGGVVRWLGRRLASPSWRRRLWGAGAAPLGLLAEAAAHAHGRVPLWLDRPLSIAPERGVELDYERFAELVVETSGQLFAAGLRPGDRVAIIKAHNLDVVALAQAAARLGAVPALIAPEFDAHTVTSLLQRLGGPLIVSDREAIARLRLSDSAHGRLISSDGHCGKAVPLEQLRGAPPPPAMPRSEDELVAVTHTSGTTGEPKLIAHTNATLAGQAMVQVLGGRLLLGRREVIATCLTTAHARTLSGLATIAALGVPHLALVDPAPEAAAVLLARHRPTLIETFPNVFQRWEALADDSRQPLANVRVFVSTFDAAHPRTVQRLLSASHRRVPVHAQAYAQSETGAIALSFRLSRRRPAVDARNVGWASLAFNRVRLVDSDTGRPVRRLGRAGAIEVAGPGLCAGYLGEPQRTTDARHGIWWRTGDIGARTMAGGLRLHGRAIDTVPGLPDYLAWEDLILQRLPELAELVITSDDAGRPVPVTCTSDDRPVDAERWAVATADLPGLPPPRQFGWDQLPTTATWKVRRPALRELLNGIEGAPEHQRQNGRR